MKALALFLSLPLFAADPRFVTLQRGQSLTLKAGEAAEVAAVIGSVVAHCYAENGERICYYAMGSFYYTYPPCAIAGPAKLAVDGGGDSVGFATFRIWPGATDPQAVALVPPGTNAVTIRLEASTNLVSWSAVHEVTLTNVPAATFYRAKASP
jgi:hypothetical protein